MIRKIDDRGLALCKFQASIFEHSLDKINSSSSYFIKSFMNSPVAVQIDNDGFIFEPENTESIFEKLKAEYKFGRGSEKYTPDSLFWMGYVFRYWCYTYQIRSKAVYRIIQADEMNSLYLPYHTLDPAIAIRRILEAKNITVERDPLESLRKAYSAEL